MQKITKHEQAVLDLLEQMESGLTHGEIKRNLGVSGGFVRNASLKLRQLGKAHLCGWKKVKEDVSGGGYEAILKFGPGEDVPPPRPKIWKSRKGFVPDVSSPVELPKPELPSYAPTYGMWGL